MHSYSFYVETPGQNSDKVVNIGVTPQQDENVASKSDELVSEKNSPEKAEQSGSNVIVPSSPEITNSTPAEPQKENFQNNSTKGAKFDVEKSTLLDSKLLPSATESLLTTQTSSKDFETEIDKNKVEKSSASSVSIFTVTPVTLSASADDLKENSTKCNKITTIDSDNCKNSLASDAVNGRAVTITATSGPAPQGNSRSASPPSVSITAVVRDSHVFGHPQSISHSDRVNNNVGAGPPNLPLHLTNTASHSSNIRMDPNDGSSDSGVSVTERSISRSSVLSDDRASSVEVKPNTPTPSSIVGKSISNILADRKESSKIWRNPAISSHSDYRHLHFSQHSPMSHFSGVPPHIPPSAGSSQSVSHPSHHPPSTSLSHAISPLHHYPGHGPPLPLNPGSIQPSLAAAALYNPQLTQDMWKHLSALPAHGYPQLLPRPQEEMSYLEQHSRELLEKQQAERIHSQRREAEARDKQTKEKMDRERIERQRERERREREEKERIRREWGNQDLQLVNRHFEQSLGSYAQKKASHWPTQPVASMPMKIDAHRGQSRYPPINIHVPESMKKAKEPEQFVQEGIFKGFRAEEAIAESLKSPHPPPAHSKHPIDKLSIQSGYAVPYSLKDQGKHSSYPVHHEKASVIVQPELKLDKVAHHTASPKRPPDRTSVYQSVPNSYKPYEAHRSSSHHPSLSSSPHSIELAKARHPLPPGHASPAHSDRYYPPGTKPSSINPLYQSNLVSASLVQNQLHGANPYASKSKVSSPPPQFYGKPGMHSTSTPIYKLDTRPHSQHIPTTVANSSANGPPPAHSSNKNESRPSATLGDQRILQNRSPFDSRHYATSPVIPYCKSGSGHTGHAVQAHSTSSKVANSHAVQAQSNIPAQTQPLDLGVKEPPADRRPQSPTSDPKRSRLDPAGSPQLSRVSAPSPLYPTAATTITTIENTAINLERISSPLRNQNQPNADSKTNNNTRPNSRPSQSSTPVQLDASSPNSKQNDNSDNGRSPSPAKGGYVHKIKKAWLQRHASGSETSSPTPGAATRGTTPTPPPSSNGNSLNTKEQTSGSSNNDTKLTNSRKPRTIPGIPNGHAEDFKDSTSTDTEGSNSSKLKRGKMKRGSKRVKKSSDSNSDSGKESDGSDGSGKKTDNSSKSGSTDARRRRGRKPKSRILKESKSSSTPIQVSKKPARDEPLTDPLQKPPIAQLKRTGESFLQDRSCYEVAPKLPKCRECRWTAHQRNKKMPNIFCRFYAFRRLRYTKNSQIAVAGFSEPLKDAYGDDLRLWVPDPAAHAADLDAEMSKFLISYVGDQFCDLVQQEKDAMELHIGENKVVAWKRVVQGVREMCDVCETTLFNIHWACSKCGFVVCIDCYKGRKEGTIKLWGLDEGAKERDKYSWLLCASRVPHEQDKLMLTQIIAGNALVELGKKVHEIRYKWGVPMYCGCPEANKYQEKDQEDKKLNGLNKDLMKSLKRETKNDLINGAVKKEEKNEDDSLKFFADVALSNDKQRESESSNSDSDSDNKMESSTLRELLGGGSKTSQKDESGSGNVSSKTKEPPCKKKKKLDTLDDVISCVIERGVDKDNNKDLVKVELKHFIRKYNYNRKAREPLPIRIMTKTESRLLYPNIHHSWLCDGKLLRLHEPLNDKNQQLFQDQWKRGQPVIVSSAGHILNKDLWSPQSFSKDFGELKNNLINCLTENLVPNQPMKKFWDGFENISKRLPDDKGQPMILKIKDWPPSDDFAEILPTRFDDLMKNLPMPQYTRRDGTLNLAGRLPDTFVRPDLGPKMYIAYGSAAFPSKASTNLHLDISDATNIICYVGVPKETEEVNLKETLKAIDEAGCDILTRQRVREKEEIPGALWHIYHSRDADKIRDLLNKVAIERGKKLEPHHDPIHDQSWYLDGPLRDRLYKEYAVEGYAIVQCLGDALFIPAGTPHQVRNLNNCIKVAEDFVSPENISHCFHLTQEFRHLSDTHTNHEDKLQIKNIIYHAMKDSVASLISAENEMQSNSTSVKKESK